VKNTRYLVVAAIAFLAGCGGGGGGGTTPAIATPTTAPSNAPTSTPTAWKQTATVKLSWKLPATQSSVKARKPQYVSASSAEVTTQVLSVNNGTPPSWVTPNPSTVALTVGSNCSVSSNIETCAITVPAPPGTVVYGFEVLDGSSPAKVLSETPAGGVSETIVQGQSNVLPPVNLEAVVANVEIGTFSTLAADTPSSQVSSVTALDADGNSLTTGNAVTFYNPFTISDGDATGATELLAGSGGCPPNVGTVTPSTSLTFSGDSGSGNSFTLCYTGLATGSATNQIALGLTLNGTAASFDTANGGGNGIIDTTISDITSSGTTYCDASVSCLATDPDYDQWSLFFDSTTAGSQLFSVSEPGWTDNPYDETITLTLDENATDSGYCGGAGSPVVTVNSVGSNGWSVSPQNTGYCEATLTENLPSGYGGVFPPHSSSSVSQIWFSVTNTSFSVNAKSRHGAAARKH